MKRTPALLLVAAFLGGPASKAQESIDLQAITQIRDEGLDHSQAMDSTWNIVDRFGPRLTGSPNLRAAAEWVVGRLHEWGIEKAEIEPWGQFGRGWTFEKISVELTKPSYMPIIAIPEAWTPSTPGRITGTPVMIGEVETAKDLEPFAGKVSGKIVLLGATRDVEAPMDPLTNRYDDDELADLEKAPEPTGGRQGDWRERYRERRARQQEMRDWFVAQGVAAILEPGRKGDYGLVFIGAGGSWDPDAKPAVPSIVITQEHFNRIARLLEHDAPVEVAVDSQTTFHDQDLQGYNVVAEIPGTDPTLGDELVMLGSHFDSWHAATGATDNGSSCAVSMEVMRILHEIASRPRRTIRMVLWTGEEQGLLGSAAYVKNHFADPETMTLLPEHMRVAGYFNLDNGSGRIRGIYCQSNAAVKPIFEAWLEPLHDLGATTVTMRDTGSTDHVSFDRVGLPGFQFIQDPMDYSTRTHHSNMDLYDRVVPADVIQASVVMSSFVYLTANRDEKLPRKSLPAPRPKPQETKPKASGAEGN